MAFKKGQGYWLGKKRSKKTIKKMQTSMRKSHKFKKFGFQKGHPQFNTGRTHFKEGVSNNVKEKNPMWKGGRKKHGNYIRIYKPKHPYSDSRGYILEHRFIMEKKLKRYLKSFEKVHHRNNIKNDNRPENLELFINPIHYGKVKCPFCNKKFLIR